MTTDDSKRQQSARMGDFDELLYVSHHPVLPSRAQLAGDVLDALTRRLADYDRLSKALTEAQEAATRNLERARKAEAECDASVVSERGQLRKALDDSRALAERLGEAFDCHPGELPRVGRSLSRAMTRIAKCVDMVRADDDEVADAVERLRRERDEYRQAARVEASLGDEARAEAKALRKKCDELRTAKPEPKLTPLRHRVTGVRPYDGGRENAHTFDVASIDVRYDGAAVTRWELRIGAWLYSADYGPIATSKDRALTDVNAVLARYGYVLEAWP